MTKEEEEEEWMNGSLFPNFLSILGIFINFDFYSICMASEGFVLI